MTNLKPQLWHICQSPTEIQVPKLHRELERLVGASCYIAPESFLGREVLNDLLDMTSFHVTFTEEIQDFRYPDLLFEDKRISSLVAQVSHELSLGSPRESARTMCQPV